MTSDAETDNGFHRSDAHEQETSSNVSPDESWKDAAAAGLSDRSKTGLASRDSLLLLRAVADNNVDVVSCLLDLGADVDVTSREGHSALHLAADLGYADLCAVLAEHGADVNSPTPAGLTPLFLASRRNARTVRTLLRFGADVGVITPEGQTTLHAAASSGLDDVIAELIASGADVNAVSNEGLTPLWLAASSGCQNALRILLQYGADPNHVLGAGLDAPRRRLASDLYDSVVDHHQQKLQKPRVHTLPAYHHTPSRVLHLRHIGEHRLRQDDPHDEEHSQQPDKQQQQHLSEPPPVEDYNSLEYTFSPFEGSRQGIPQPRDVVSPYLVFQLPTTQETATQQSRRPYLACRPDLEHLEPTFRGMTSLHRAAQLGMESVARALLEAGAHVNAMTEKGETPLHFAALYSSISGRGEVAGLVRLLVKSGAEVEAINCRGETPLHLAASVGDAVTTAILVSVGASVRAADLCGDVPLHKACRRLLAPESNFLRTVRLLLGAAGAPPPNAVNRDGHAPLHLLLFCQESATNLDLLRELLKRGADVNLRTGAGEHPLTLALRFQKVTSAIALLKEGADPNAMEADGTTPMHFACQMGDVSLFRLLWSKGGDPSHVNSSGFTPLRCAVSCRPEVRYDIVRACAEVGAACMQRLVETNFVSSGDEIVTLPSGLTVFLPMLSSPFHYAFSQGDIAVMQLLLTSGAVTCRELHETRKACLLTDVLDLSAQDRQAIQFVLTSAASPPSLQVLTQWKISQLVGCRVDRSSRVNCLGLPSMLKEFVLFANL